MDLYYWHFVEELFGREKIVLFGYMIRLSFLFCFVCLLLIHNLDAAPLNLSGKELNSPPPRIIRTCCSFGTDMRMSVIPFLKLTEITTLEELGNHHYLGDGKEGNGIIYTLKGGFIDIGHLRDQADWTAYLYALIVKNKANGGNIQKLGYEGGVKTLTLQLLENIDSVDAINLAGKIAYDLSVWHEIATWYGASTIPLVPERYSSFSVEDVYSNLLGVTLGIKALQSDLPYEEAMTKFITETLTDLGAVDNEADTYTAMEDVHNVWWTRTKRLPSRKVLIERQLKAYPCSLPWLVPGWGYKIEPYELEVPERTKKGELLTDFYELNFLLNHKFPYKKIFPDRKNRDITQDDFGLMIAFVEQELIRLENRTEKAGRLINRNNRKEKRLQRKSLKI